MWASSHQVHINIPPSQVRLSCLSLENYVLMHQCTIVQMISNWCRTKSNLRKTYNYFGESISFYLIIMIIKLRRFRKELFVQLHCIEYNREMQIDIICTIVQLRISALFSKGAKRGVLWRRMLRLMMALESLLSESQTSNLTQAQNELPAFTLIFLIFFYDLALRTFKTAYVSASMDLRKWLSM